MKFLILFALIAAAAASAVSPNDPIPIVSQEADVGFDGTYQHSYESGDGTVFQEQGVLKNAGNKETEAEEISGSYEFTAPDGTKYAVRYVANENGFQPEADHLPVAPTPPPIPALIQKSLDWIAAHPQPEEKGKKF